MMVIALIAFFIVGSLILFLGSVGFCLLIRGWTRRGGSRALHIGIGIPLFLPLAFSLLVQYDSPLSSAWYKAHYLRACRRRTEIDLPTEPNRSHGLELTSAWDVGLTGADEGVLDLVSNPFLYLDGHKFAFVEHRGRRYSGTRSDYQVEAYDTPRAEYVIYLGRSSEPGAAQFQLTVLERSGQRRVGSITGYLGLEDSCPRYADIKEGLERMIKPLPHGPEREPVPPQRLEARAVRPRREADGRIDTALTLSGPVSQCPTLEHPTRLKDGPQLVFTSGRGTRHITLLDTDGKQLYLMDLVCDSGDVMALLRGHSASNARPFLLHRYSSDGSLIGRYQIHTSDRHNQHSLEPISSAKVFARNSELAGDRLTFQVVKLQFSPHTGWPQRQESIHWYELALPCLINPHWRDEAVTGPID